MKNQMVGLSLIVALCVSQHSFAQTAKPYSVAGKKVTVYSTAQNTDLKLTETGTLEFKQMGQPVETQVCVFVDSDKKFQSYMGMGGALTDASAETFYKLPADKQQEILKAYFDKTNGIGYTLGRTNIASCDFSSDTYNYVNENDKELKSFNVEHDKQYKIPLIKEAIKAAGGKLIMFASPWSPPAWMKDNNDVLHGGHLKKDFYQSWANYYPKFIRAYEKLGIPIWGISVQNEPMAKQTWESCIYTAEEERDFLKNNLGPTMEKAGLKNVKIIVWDHNRDLMYQRAQTYFDDPAASKYAWGIGFHWYENWSGGDNMYSNVKLVHEAYPNKQILFTEGCVEKFTPTRLTDWALGERYGRSLINDFNNGMNGFTDWNILLDENGGPNHVGNFCFAPIHADTKTGQVIYTNAYYYIGHISKFVKPGAKRIVSSPSRSQLLSTAFVNPDGKVVVVVMNQSDAEIPYFLWIKGKAAEVKAAAHSMSTLIF